MRVLYYMQPLHEKQNDVYLIQVHVQDVVKIAAAG